MIKKEISGVFKSRRQIIFVLAVILIPIIDLILVWKNSVLADYIFHKEAYLNPPSFESITHPAKAAFLSGSSRGHLMQMVYIWLMPIWILNIYTDGYISECSRGYCNMVFIRENKKKYVLSKYLTSYLIPFIVVMISLLINFILSNILFMGGESFHGLEALMECGGYFEFQFKNPNLTYLIYILIASTMAGLSGIMCQGIVFISRKYIVAYFVSFMVWIVLISIRYNIAYIFQPFIEWGPQHLVKGFIIFLTIVLISFLAGLGAGMRKDEM